MVPDFPTRLIGEVTHQTTDHHIMIQGRQIKLQNSEIRFEEPFDHCPALTRTFSHEVQNRQEHLQEEQTCNREEVSQGPRRTCSGESLHCG